jgi:hypothetical protein
VSAFFWPGSQMTADFPNLYRELKIEHLLQFERVYAESRAGKKISAIAKALNVDPGTLKKTMLRLSDQAKKECFDGEGLFGPAPKGYPWSITPAGEAFYELCKSVNECLKQHVDRIEKTKSFRCVRIAMPQLPLHDLFRIEVQINKRLEKLGSKRFEKELIHIRSEHLPKILIEDKDIDYAIGGLIDPQQSLDDSLEYIKIAERHYDLISNFDFADEYKVREPLQHEFLRSHRVPLIIANVGVIVDCLLKTIGLPRRRNEDIIRQLAEIKGPYNVVGESNDVHFLIELLCMSPQQLCMLGTEDIFLRAQDRVRSEEVRRHWVALDEDAPPIKRTKISNLPPLQICVIRRRVARGETAYAANHPFSLFWNATNELAGTERKPRTK